MSKFVTSERLSSRAGEISWQLAQTFWVGGLWLLHFAVLPALGKIGLAPLLIEEIRTMLSPMLLGFAAVAALLQALVLVQAEGSASLWRDVRGQLLLSTVLLVLAFFVVRTLEADVQRWLVFNYLLVAMCGVLLVLQPIPGRSAAGGPS